MPQFIWKQIIKYCHLGYYYWLAKPQCFKNKCLFQIKVQGKRRKPIPVLTTLLFNSKRTLMTILFNFFYNTRKTFFQWWPKPPRTRRSPRLECGPQQMWANLWPQLRLIGSRRYLKRTIWRLAGPFTGPHRPKMKYPLIQSFTLPTIIIRLTR